MKKIIFVHLLNDFSGSPKVLSQVIIASENAGLEATLFTCKGSTGFLTGVTKNHKYYVYKRFENKLGTLVSFTISQIHLFFKLLTYRNEPVVIYINTMLPFGAALFGKLFRKPVYYHIHEISFTTVLLKKWLRLVVQKTATKILFVSKAVKEAESFKNKEQTVIYNALPETFLKQALASPYRGHLQQEPINVLMLCSLKAYKGLLEFIKIASLCQSEKQLTFTLVLNADETSIHEYLSKHTLPENITIKATQKDVQTFYQKAGLVLNLSRIDQCVETFGLTITEAMAYGIPVIVPPVGGPAEIVTDGKEGFLMASYEVEAISNKIIALSKNAAWRLELSAQARTRAMDFNEATFNAAILNVLHA